MSKRDLHKKLIRTWNIKPGDFINFTFWYGDVWSEVKEYNNDEVTVYRQMNGNLVISIISVYWIRKLCRKENIDKIKTCYIVTSKQIIPRYYPMDYYAYAFQGDKHI